MIFFISGPDLAVDQSPNPDRVQDRSPNLDQNHVQMTKVAHVPDLHAQDRVLSHQLWKIIVVNQDHAQNLKM